MQRTVSALRRDMNRSFKVSSYNVRTPLGERQAELHRVVHYPTLLVLDSDGTVRERVVGLVSAEQLRIRIEGVLAELQNPGS